MSRGYGGFAAKELEDEDWVIYEYGAFNLNNEKAYDGNLTIAKSTPFKDKVVLKKKKLPKGGHCYVEKKVKT